MTSYSDLLATFQADQAANKLVFPDNAQFTPQGVAAYNASPGVTKTQEDQDAAAYQYAVENGLGTRYDNMTPQMLQAAGITPEQVKSYKISSAIGAKPDLFGGTYSGPITYHSPNDNPFNLGLAAALFAAPYLASVAFPATLGAEAGLGAGASEASLASGAGFDIASAAEDAALAGAVDAAPGSASLLSTLGAGAAGAAGAGTSTFLDAVDPASYSGIASSGGSSGLSAADQAFLQNAIAGGTSPIGAGTLTGTIAQGAGSAASGLSSILGTLTSTPAGLASLLSSGIQGIGGVVSSYLAGNAQKDAASNATAAQTGFFNTANQNLQPFIQTGAAASNKIRSLEGLDGGTPSSIQSTLETLPGYQFEKQQGLKSTQNSATARGLGVSGAAQKGAATYATGLANSNYNNFLTGLQNTANTGAGAAGTLTGAATNTGQQIGSNIIGAGNAGAGSIINSSNAVGNAIGSIPQNLLLQQLLQQNQNSGGGSGSSIYG